MGSGFPKYRPVDEAGREAIDIWGAKRLGAGIGRIIGEKKDKNSQIVLVLTGGLQNEVTKRTLAEVSREQALRILDEEDVRMAENIGQFEVSTRGDVREFLSVIRSEETVEVAIVVTEEPHWARVQRIFREETAMLENLGEVTLELLPSGAPTPKWYARKERLVEWAVRRQGEKGWIFRFIAWAWDFCKPIFLNMPRKPGAL